MAATFRRATHLKTLNILGVMRSKDKSRKNRNNAMLLYLYLVAVDGCGRCSSSDHERNEVIAYEKPTARFRSVIPTSPFAKEL
jgi:hypothetical protein